VGEFVEKGNMEAAAAEAAKYTDTKYIENLKSIEKRARRPDGHSFKAVEVLKSKYQNQDKYLIYKLNDGSDGSIPFVLKSSLKKVEMMKNLDKDGTHPLSTETIHLDVLHSHTKGWKTYTLSYYDQILRQMVKVATMECPTEDKKCCKLFFTVINEMLQEYTCDKESIVESSYVLNPYHLKDDENGGNKIGMREVLGEAFVNERTSSCEYHFDASVKVHKKYVSVASRQFYSELCISLKASATEELFQENKMLLETLIGKQ